jgi:fatty acid desaturase
VFRTKWLNTLFLYIFSVLFWWEPFDYAASHTYHHRYSQFPEGDRENLFPLEPSLDPWLMLELFTVNVTSGCGRVFGKGGLVSTIKLTVKAALGGVASEPGAEQYEWLQAVHADQPEEFIKSRWFSRAIVAFHAAVCGAALASGQWIFIPIVSLHAFVGNWYSYFVGNCQHCGLRSSVPGTAAQLPACLLSVFKLGHVHATGILPMRRLFLSRT